MKWLKVKTRHDSTIYYINLTRTNHIYIKTFKCEKRDYMEKTIYFDFNENLMHFDMDNIESIEILDESDLLREMLEEMAKK